MISVFKLPEHLLKPCSMDAIETKAVRLRDVSLFGKKFTEHFHFSPRGILDGLKAMTYEKNTTH
jgi:hypothetical protein